MEALECIKTRRSVRSYKPDPIPEAVMEKLKEAIRSAPSAANRQPWKFIIVKDPEIRKQMIEKCQGQKFLGEAPVVIIGCGLTKEAWHGVGGNRQLSSVEIDLAIAIDHLTLAAASLGLGTCWVCAFNEPCFKKLLNVPGGVRIIALTPVGFPKEEKAFRPYPRGARKPAEEIFCVDTYK